jgi:hypothetical protein
VWRLGLLGAVAACNAVFGNDQVHTKIDDLRLLKPPLDTPASCPPPPDFSTWTIAPRVYPGINNTVIHPTFLSDQDVVFSYQEVMFEGDLDASPTKLAGLDDMTGARLAGAAAAPGGDVFWYTRYANLGGGSYYAVRDGEQWSPHVADFSVTAYSVEPGSAGFYGSEVRMVVAVQRKSEDPFELAELSSPDGTSWTELGPLNFGTAALDSPFLDPMLSVDGCVLLFGRGTVGIEVALRGADGTFGQPMPFPGAAADTDAAQPAIAPDETLVWWESSEGDRQATP